MKRALTLVVALSVVLLASAASAVTWVTWHCPATNPNPPPPSCDSLGKTHYTCDKGHYFSQLALVDSDGSRVGPPDTLCPTCAYTNWTPADSVLCHNEEVDHHRFYRALGWAGYNYYMP